MQTNKTTGKIRFLTYSAVIAALYIVLTYLAQLVGLSGQNAIQCRFSEALCILPYFTPAAIPGVTLGCFLANLLTGAAWPDLVFGTLATLIGAVGTRLLRKWKYLASVPPILANTLIIPFVVRYAYANVEESLPFLFLTVFLGEVISCGLLGTLLQLALDKRNIFKEN